MGLKAPMRDDNRLMMKRTAREIHEITYLRHVTGASEAEIRRAMEKFGGDRARIERELRRQQSSDAGDSDA